MAKSKTLGAVMVKAPKDAEGMNKNRALEAYRRCLPLGEQ